MRSFTRLPPQQRRASIAEVLLFREPVAKKDIPLLTPELAQIYATSGPKTLARDLNEQLSKFKLAA